MSQDNPFLTSAGKPVAPMPQGDAKFWAGCKGSANSAAMSRGGFARRHGRDGFSIDPARLDAYRRRKAACMGISRQAADDLRKAQRALEAQQSQARRWYSEGKNVPADLAARIENLQADLDDAVKRFDASESEVQTMLALANRIERHVAAREEHAATAEYAAAMDKFEDVDGEAEHSS